MTPQEYIKNILAPTRESAFGRCEEITGRMQKEFPGLKLVRGHYLCPVWGRRAHWWLTDENGIIIDPTAVQFPSLGNGTYLPWDETKPEPTGKCMNCGTYCFWDLAPAQNRVIMRFAVTTKLPRTKTSNKTLLKVKKF